MAQNGTMNFSTLLLLGVLVFLIYCLMKQPKTNENLSNTNTRNVELQENENFEDVSTDDISDQISVDTASDDEDDESEIDTATESDDSMSFATAPAPAVRDFTSQPPQAPAVSQDLINKITPQTSGPVQSTLLNNATSIFGFEPSDDSVNSGASLNNAFERPVPDNADTDVVDLNKNNVTNYSATDYLPKEINDDWFNTDFSQAKYKMNDDKLINTDKYVVGVNTVGQSLKNASYDIRGAINVPKYTISPWNNSTIEPDYNIKPLC